MPKQDAQATFVGTLLTEAREETVKADAKAGLVLASLSVGLGALLAGMIAGDWSPSDLSYGGLWFWWPGAASLAAALACAGLAVWPRFKVPKDCPAEITYWGEAAKCGSLKELTTALSNRPDAAGRATNQFWILSRIVVAKYRLLQWSLALTAAGAVLCGLGAVLGTG